MASVRVPSPMQPVVGGRKSVDVEGATLGQALEDLFRRYPEIRERIVTADGNVQPHLMIVVDGTEAAGPFVPVRPDSEIVIVPAVGGGGAAQSVGQTHRRPLRKAAQHQGT